MTVVNEPEEVSLCWAGARGPEARCHSIFDSNTQSYKPINAAPISISASAHSSETEELEFYALANIQMSTTVAASVAPPQTETPAAAPAAAAPAQSFSLTSPAAPEAGLQSDAFSVAKIKALADSKIPNKEQRLEAQLNANELTQALAKMQAEKAQYSKELEEYREIKAAEAREKKRKQDELKELQRKVVGDFEMTLAKTDEERAAVPDKINGMSDEMLETLYRTVTRVKASLYPSMPTQRESDEEIQNRLKIRQYLDDKGIDTLKKEEMQPTTVSASSYSSWDAKTTQARDNAQVLFEKLKDDPSFWGKPLKSPPQSMVVQASKFSPHIQQVPTLSKRTVEWKGGQGLNMDWSFMKPNEAAVHAIHGVVDMPSESKLKLSQLVSSRETLDLLAKHRKEGGDEYDSIMASKASMGLEDRAQLQPHLRMGGGINWIEDQFAARSRGR